MQIKIYEAQVRFQKCKASKIVIIWRKMSSYILFVIEEVGTAIHESNLELSLIRILFNKSGSCLYAVPYNSPSRYSP